MSRVLFFALVLLLPGRSFAQLRYVFTSTTSPYVPLTGATSLNNGLIWHEEKFTVPLPFTWYVDSSRAVTDFHVNMRYQMVIADSGDYEHAYGFLAGIMDIVDRGAIDGVRSRSPISYRIVGSSPNRIFQFEILNGGFNVERGMFLTMNDSFNMQLWIYESSDVFEYRFGPSKVAPGAEYFAFHDSGPLLAFCTNFDLKGGTKGTAYTITGQTSHPTIDSVKLRSTLNGKLQGWPADGQVYRFTPRHKYVPTGIRNVPATTDVVVAPSISDRSITIANNEPGNVGCVMTSSIGAMVMIRQFSHGRTELDISQLPAGIYYLHFSADGRTTNQKFTKL